MLRPPSRMTPDAMLLIGILAGIVAGLLAGGRLSNLLSVRVRFGALILVALAPPRRARSSCSTRASRSSTQLRLPLFVLAFGRADRRALAQPIAARAAARDGRCRDATASRSR